MIANETEKLSKNIPTTETELTPAQRFAALMEKKKNGTLRDASIDRTRDDHGLPPGVKFKTKIRKRP